MKCKGCGKEEWTLLHEAGNREWYECDNCHSYIQVQRDPELVPKVTRCGAIMGKNYEKKEIAVFGYGIYAGECAVPAEIHMAGQDMEGILNPCICLDSGEEVFGCECWWGLEEQIKATLAKAEETGFTIVSISPADYRKLAATVAKTPSCDAGCSACEGECATEAKTDESA
jgi:hypothetical protein